jgi:hypothetical protein
MTDSQRNLEIVFEKRGDYYEQIVRKSRTYSEGAIVLKNKCFVASLKYIGYNRGQSRLNIKWLDEESGRIYYSGMSFLDEKLIEGKIHGGVLVGSFCFRKQGTSILLCEYVHSKLV